MIEDNIICVTNLKKEFKVHKKEKEGLLSSMKQLINRTYVHIAAVDGINLKVKEGEIRGLIGPNGAGKSTTIKMLSGVLYPTSGEVKVMGYTPWLQREEYVKRIGVLFGQKSQLWWDLPPADTFSLHREMYKIPPKTFKDNIEYFVENLNLYEIIKRPVRQLSLGERMKCELVCALLHQPPLIYLDEPTIGLDIVAKEAVRSFIKQVNRDKKTTFIITTHDLLDIENLCEKVTIINKGTIVYDDTLEQLKQYFVHKKVIDITFVKPISRELLQGFNVKSFNNITAELEVELCGETSISSEMSKILSALPVHDINVNDISIEEVIREIYSS